MVCMVMSITATAVVARPRRKPKQQIQTIFRSVGVWELSTRKSAPTPTK
jgi:hypothetical protein